MWLYQRSKGYLTVTFGRNGRVESYSTPAANNSKKAKARRKAATNAKANNEWQQKDGTPL
jgi:outer membrane protein assembly factor BamE (lipoprotein component of BamABCDE complex)